MEPELVPIVSYNLNAQGQPTKLCAGYAQARKQAEV